LDLEDSIQETTLTGEEFDEQKPQLVNSTNASINNDDNPFLSDPSDSGSIEPQSKSPLDLKAVNSQGGKKPGDILAAVTAGTSLLSGVTGYVDAYEELNNQQPETIPPISYTQETNIENLQDDLATLGVEYVDPDVQIQDSQISDIQDALQTIDAGYIEPETIGEMKAEEHLKRIEEMSEEEQVFKIETLLDPPKNNNQSSAKQFNETIATDTTQNTVDTIYDTPKVDDISEWLGEINPNYDPFDWDSPYCNNCGSCAFAVQKRFEGDSNIVATSENIGTIEEMNALTGMEQVPMSPNEIADYLISQGPGACGIVGIDRVSGPGHWFNAYYDGTKVVAIDAQTGQISDWPPDYGDVTNWDISVRKEVKS